MAICLGVQNVLSMGVRAAHTAIPFLSVTTKYTVEILET